MDAGIYVDDILEAVPIDKYFELFKPKNGGEGGFIRVAMNFSTESAEDALAGWCPPFCYLAGNLLNAEDHASGSGAVWPLSLLQQWCSAAESVCKARYPRYSASGQLAEPLTMAIPNVTVSKLRMYVRRRLAGAVHAAALLQELQQGQCRRLGRGSAHPA